MVVGTSLASSVAIDFGKLFSSSFGFLSSYTARVMNRLDALKMRCPLFSRKQTCIGRSPKVGFSDLIPNLLRVNQFVVVSSSGQAVQPFCLQEQPNERPLAVAYGKGVFAGVAKHHIGKVPGPPV